MPCSRRHHERCRMSMHGVLWLWVQVGVHQQVEQEVLRVVSGQVLQQSHGCNWPHPELRTRVRGRWQGSAPKGLAPKQLSAVKHYFFYFQKGSLVFTWTTSFLWFPARKGLLRKAVKHHHFSNDSLLGSSLYFAPEPSCTTDLPRATPPFNFLTPSKR